MQKRGIFRASTRGCDAARKATWQRHANPRECLRGTEVTNILYIYYIGYRKYKPSIEDIANLLFSTHLIYPQCSVNSFRVRLLSSILFDHRQHGVTWIVGSIAR